MLHITAFSSEIQNMYRDLFDHVLWRGISISIHSKLISWRGSASTNFCPSEPHATNQLLWLSPPFDLCPPPTRNHSLQNIFWIYLFTSFSTATVRKKPSFYLQHGQMLQPSNWTRELNSGSPSLSLSSTFHTADKVMFLQHKPDHVIQPLLKNFY